MRSLIEIPLVSICCIAYNQENYIAQTIESFLAQKTTFRFEIIIGEDCSTDGTIDIVKNYQHNYRKLIKVIRSNENVGARANGARVLAACQGKYIAPCEGDDYWTDPYKLQKQVDFLEANPDYGLIFTDADHYYERDGKLIPAYDKTFRRKIPTGDVLSVLLQGKNPYRTCTSMFRRSLIGKHAEISSKYRFKMGDKILWFIIAGQAKIGYIDHSTAVYRLREKSASHCEDLDDFISFLKSSYRVNIYFSAYYKQPLDRKKIKINYRTAVLKYCVDKKDFKKLIEYSGCLPIALAAIAKEKLRDLIVLVRKLT